MTSIHLTRMNKTITFDTPYFSYSLYLQHKYGEKLYRIPVDPGFGCPNRNEDGSGGCSFCPSDGARAVQTTDADTVEEQVKAAVEFARRRYRAKNFAAYLQAFTGTFAPVSEQRKIYQKILEHIDFKAIYIGARPDCLDEATLGYFAELNKKTDVCVELGVQTLHDETLKRIHRGHSAACSIGAIKRLKQRGIDVAVHVIFGLPGETPAHFRKTAEVLAGLPIDGIKLHNLHIIAGSDLAREYVQNPFPLPGVYEYLEAVIDFIRRIPPSIPIMRLRTDTQDENLIAPEWGLAKGRFIELVEKHMTMRMVRQGDLAAHSQHTNVTESSFKKVTTSDGSVTFWNHEFKEHYHTTVGARTEAESKYAAPADLEAMLDETDVRLLDVCFGLGYNTLAACRIARKVGKGKLSVHALEIDKRAVASAAEAVDDAFSADLLSSLVQSREFQEERISVSINWGDARYTAGLTEKGHFDLIFLDAFSTQRNSELWTMDFFKILKTLLTKKGKLFTYCTSLPVRSGLMQAGFYVGDSPAFGNQRSGTVAAVCRKDIRLPQSDRERNLIQTTARGIPYRDPNLTNSNREILKRRECQVAEFRKQQQP